MNQRKTQVPHPRLRRSSYTPPVGVAVSVVITQQIVFPHRLVPGNLQGLVHRGEEVLTQTGHLEANTGRNRSFNTTGHRPAKVGDIPHLRANRDIRTGCFLSIQTSCNRCQVLKKNTKNTQRIVEEQARQPKQEWPCVLSFHFRSQVNFLLSHLSDSLDRTGSPAKVGIRYQWETKYLEDKGVQIAFHRLTWTPFSTSKARTQKRPSFHQDSPAPNSPPPPRLTHSWAKQGEQRESVGRLPQRGKWRQERRRWR